MADIELVIKIPEETVNKIKDNAMFAAIPSEILWDVTSAIVNSTPLPKGHGRLGDLDAFIAMLEDATERQRYKELLIDDCLTVDDVIEAIIESLKNEGLAEGDAPTIIPADKEGQEE